MTAYNDTVRKHRRLAILRHLEQCAEYVSDASILTDVLAGVGVRSSYSQVITELAWLKENGFLEFDDKADFVVVTATRTGIEVATGQATHPEIQRPRPKG